MFRIIAAVSFMTLFAQNQGFTQTDTAKIIRSINSLVQDNDKKAKSEFYTVITTEATAFDEGRANPSLSAHVAFDKKASQLYKVFFEFPKGDDYYIQTFHYDHHLLIFAEVIVQRNGTRTYTARYYFADERPIKITGEDSRYTNHKDLLREARAYLQFFKNDFLKKYK